MPILLLDMAQSEKSTYQMLARGSLVYRIFLDYTGPNPLGHFLIINQLPYHYLRPRLLHSPPLVRPTLVKRSAKVQPAGVAAGPLVAGVLLAEGKGVL